MTVSTQNHVYNADGSIDCEVYHSELGWLPFTASAQDSDSFGQQVWLSVKDRLDIAAVPPAPPRTGDEVTRYAEQLIEQGTNVTVSGGTAPIYARGTLKDTRNLQGLVTSAQLRITASDTTTIDFRDGNNVTHTLSPAQVVEMWEASAAFVQAVYAASWSIKADNPIPQNFEADPRWP